MVEALEVALWKLGKRCAEESERLLTHIDYLLDCHSQNRVDYYTLGDEWERCRFESMNGAEFKQFFQSELTNIGISLRSLANALAYAPGTIEECRWSKTVSNCSRNLMGPLFDGLESMNDAVRYLVVQFANNESAKLDFWIEAAQEVGERLSKLRNGIAVLERDYSIADYAYLQALSELENQLTTSDNSIADKDAAQAANEIPQLPVWNRDNGELQFGGTTIRKIKRMGNNAKPTNVVIVLNTFQELNWPYRIDDPLPGGANPERLNDTVKSLNEGITGIRFRADGTGGGIRWEVNSTG